MPLIVRYLGLCPYTTVWDAMQNFTNERNETSRDELWIVQHLPVFTQGQAGKAEHILNAGDIPVVKSDRGGQVTYHGPGQLIAYPLLNLRRLDIGVRDLVTRLETSIINFLKEFDVEACAKENAPGVYVKEKKIASLGLRVRRGCSFHGVSLNVNMDLAPFLRINPCGYHDMQMTQLSEFVEISMLDLQSLQPQFAQSIAKAIGYDAVVTE